VILDDKDRPRRFIEALEDAVDALEDAVHVDEGRLALHGHPQPFVVAMVRIGAAVAIAEEAAVGEVVVVGAVPALAAVQPMAIRGDPLAAGRWR
jgi:hypothetical protein